MFFSDSKRHDTPLSVFSAFLLHTRARAPGHGRFDRGSVASARRMPRELHRVRSIGGHRPGGGPMLRVMRVVNRLLVMGAIIALPVSGYAQEAVVTGTVTDRTGAVLPGVTVTALHEASGNTFVAVTDQRGAFRLPVRTGVYRITVELQGFATVGPERPGAAHRPAGGREFSDGALRRAGVGDGHRRSAAGRHHDARPEAATSIRGRCRSCRSTAGTGWTLRCWRPGAGATRAAFPDNRQGLLAAQRRRAGDDGAVRQHGRRSAQVQPRRDRRVRADHEPVRCHAGPLGRPAGERHHEVGHQHAVGTVLGLLPRRPLQRGRLHPAARAPVLEPAAERHVRRPDPAGTGSISSPTTNTSASRRRSPTRARTRASTSISPTRVREHKAGARLDVQFTSQTRLAVRGQDYNQVFFDGGGAVLHPAGAHRQERYTRQVLGTLTQVFGNQAVNEIRGGAAFWDSARESLVRCNGDCFPGMPVGCTGFPNIFFRGYSIQSPGNMHHYQNMYSIRDDFARTTSLAAITSEDGRRIHLHAERTALVRVLRAVALCPERAAASQHRSAPPGVGRRRPRGTWRRCRRSSRSSGRRCRAPSFRYYIPQHMSAGWLQDDWTVTSRLTLNLGVRWDMQVGVNSEKAEFLPWLPGDLPYDRNNFAPRLGFAFSLDPTTVHSRRIRQVLHADDHRRRPPDGAVPDPHPRRSAQRRPSRLCGEPVQRPACRATRRFARNLCDINFRPGCLRRDIAYEINHPWRQHPYSHQASIGVQRQLGTTMSIEVDYVLQRRPARGERRQHESDRTTPRPAPTIRRPTSAGSRFPSGATCSANSSKGWSNYDALETAFTKRFSQRWQASATYTFAGDA